MVRYRFPANPGFNPPDRAEPQQFGESEWEDFPSQIAPPRQPHNVVLSPIGETGWGPDPQAFEEEYDHDHGHIAHLWDAGEGRQGEPPLTPTRHSLTFVQARTRNQERTADCHTLHDFSILPTRIWNTRSEAVRTLTTF